MSSAETSAFTTAASLDLVGPTVLTIEPVSGTTGQGLNVQPHVGFSEAINPLTLTSGSAYLYDYATSQYLSATVVVSADRLSATFTPVQPLTPATYYQFYVSSYTDVAGNSGSEAYTNFTTGTAAITTGPTVSAVSPARGAGGVPLNSSVQAVVSTMVDVTTLTNSAITLTPAVPGTVKSCE